MRGAATQFELEKDVGISDMALWHLSNPNENFMRGTFAYIELGKIWGTTPSFIRQSSGRTSTPRALHQIIANLMYKSKIEKWKQMSSRIHGYNRWATIDTISVPGGVQVFITRPLMKLFFPYLWNLREKFNSEEGHQGFNYVYIPRWLSQKVWIASRGKIVDQFDGDPPEGSSIIMNMQDFFMVPLCT